MDDQTKDNSYEAADAVPFVDNYDEIDGGHRAPIDLDAPVDAHLPEDALRPGGEAAAQEVEAAKAQAVEANDKYLRTLAEFQNYKRRMDGDIARRVSEGNEKLIKTLLPVLDDFDLALSHARKNDQNYEQLLEGIEAIARKLNETLEKVGVAPITALGEAFNPDSHEAVMVDSESEEPEETVTGELRRGYTLHGRVIRPALVKVAKAG